MNEWMAAGSADARRALQSPTYRLWLLLICILAIAFVFGGLMIGVRPIAFSTVMDALIDYDASSSDHIIVHDYRLPRTLLGLLCGAAFGVSGALIQAATKNPLADPGILGVNAGAAFFVTLAIGVFGLQSIDAYVWAALSGAVIVTLLVYALGSTGRNGTTPVRMVLAGVALSAVLGGIGSSITLLNPQAFNSMRMWSVGSLGGRDMDVVRTVVPFIGAGLLVAFAASRSLNAVVLGDDLARSLGARLVSTRMLVVIAVTLLAGAATAAIGPIGFLGLMVPHVVRWFAGPDQRRIIALTAIASPVLLLAADIAGRILVFPGELEVGVITAFIGAPVLILLARRSRASAP